MAIALTGQRQPLFWSGEDRDAKFDGHDLKGLLEEFLGQFGLRGIHRAESTALFLIGRDSTRQTVRISWWLSPVAKKYDLRDGVSRG